MEGPPYSRSALDAAGLIDPRVSEFTLPRKLQLRSAKVGDVAIQEAASGIWLVAAEQVESRQLSDPVSVYDWSEPRPTVEARTPGRQGAAQQMPHAPDHLAISYRPEVLKWAAGRAAEPGLLGWYEPEEREVIRDPRYPWCTVGRVRGAATAQSPGRGGTGVLVGPRHVLTASHVAFLPDGTANTMRFHPAYFDEVSPYGSSQVEKIVHYPPVVSETTIRGHEAFDIAVLILADRLGDVCGWMGTRTYVPPMEGGYWFHMGYPGQFKRRSHVPTRQEGFRVFTSEAYRGFGPGLLKNFADVTAGHSGGPIFGFWPFGGRPMPFVTAVESRGDDDPDPLPMVPKTANHAVAGWHLPALVRDARALFP